MNILKPLLIRLIPVWRIVTSNNCYSLEDLSNAINNNTGIANIVKLNVGNIYSEFWVSAKLYAPDTSGATPVFTWDRQIAAPTYPNNKFRLVFYDMSYNLVLLTDYITYTGDNTTVSYALTSTQWAAIQQTGARVICTVETYQTNPPETGSFYSNYILIYN